MRDGEIESIKITMVGVDSDKNDSVSRVYEATKEGIAKEGGIKWSQVIDPLADKSILDGSYEITVEAIDTYHHATVDKVAIKIDNTAPILVLQRPSSNWLVASENDMDTYGQDFSFVGQSADDSDVGRIEVLVYKDKECNQKLDTIVLEKIPPTVDNTVMKWAETGESAYNRLYGNDKFAGSKPYYCKLIVYDDARPCPDEGDGAGKGNSTEHYYLYNDIYTEVLSKFKLTQVYSILNGTYKSEDRAAVDSAAKVKEYLARADVQTSRGSFRLNPLNNPTFSVNGYDPLVYRNNYCDIESEDKQILNKSQVTVKVSSGLDNIPLDNESIGISLVKANSAGQKVAGEPPIVILPAASNKFGKIDLSDADKAKRAALPITNVGSYDRTITFVLDRDVYSLTIGSYYIFDVVANDTSGNEVENNGKIYGFKLASSEVPPDLNITSPTGSTNIGPNSKVVITGNTKHELNIPRLEVKIGQTLVIEGDDKTGELTNKITNTAVDTATTGDYYNIDKNSSDFGKFQITIDISQLYNIPGNEWDKGEKSLIIYSIVPDTKDPANKEGTSAQKERSLMYDNEAPEISSVRVKPTTSYNNKDNVINGEVTITVSLRDDNNIAKYYISSDSSNVKTASSKSVSGIEFVVDTTDTSKVTDDSNLVLTIYTEDEFGNNANREIYVDGDSKTQARYYVDQDSDRPVINVAGGSFELEKNKTDLTKDAKNILDKTSAKLSLALSDDDGIAKTTVKYKKEDATAFTELATSTSTNPSFAISSLADGKYEIQIEVEDIVYSTSNKDINKATATTWIGVTTGKPGFSDVKIDGAEYSDKDTYWYPSEKDITISGAITGDSGSTITRKIGTEETTITPDANKKWSNKITTGSSDAEITYTVTDIYGRTETKTINYRVDTVPPEVTISGSDRTMTNAISDNYSFSGTHKDENGSGVDKVYYKVLDRTGDTNPTAPTATKDGSGGWIEIANVSTTGWTLPITVRNYDSAANTDSDYKEGSYNLYVYSLDKAKNCSPVKTVQFDINKAKPELTLIAAKEDGTTITETNWKEYFEFKYTITDTYTPIKAPTAEIKVTRKVGDNNPVELNDSTTPKLFIGTPTKSGNVITGVVRIELLKNITDGSYDGTYTIEVTAKDAFNEPAEKTLTKTILYDTVGPTLSIAFPGDSDWIKSDSEATGTVEDAGVGVASGNVYWKVSTNSTETYDGSSDWSDLKEKGNTVKAYSSGTEWKIKPKSSTEGQSNYLHVVAVDKNGNKSSVVSQKIKIDTKAPVIGTPTLYVGSDKRTTKMINKADVDARASKKITITVDVTDPISTSSSTTNSGVKEVQLWEGSAQHTVDVKNSGSTYTITLDNTSGELSDGTHNFIIKAVDNAGNTTNSTEYKTIDVVVDTAPPTGRVSSITKTIGADKKVNGKITILGSVSDTRKLGTKINYSITDSKTPTPTTKTGEITLDGGSDTNEEWTITDFDTTQLADGDCTITITVTDEAGNTNISPITKQFVVDQTTDEPEISGESFVYDKTNRVEDYPTTITKTENKKNLLGRTANNKLTGTITDDDNIYSVTVRYAKYDDWKTNGDSATWKTPLIETDIDAEIYTLDCEMTGDSTDTNYFKEDGDYHVEIIINDAPNHGGYDTGYGERKISTNIAISTGDPTIESISVNPVAGKKDSTVTVSGTIASGMTPTLYSVDASGNVLKDTTSGNDITIPVTSVSDGNYSFSLPITVDSTAEKETVNLYYKVVNKYGQNTRNNTSYTIDNKVPEIEITAISPYVDLATGDITGISEGRYVNGKIKVAGTADDNYALKEIEYNIYKGSDNTGTKLTDTGFSSKITNANMLNSWSFEIDTTKIKDGTNYYDGPIFIEVIARDKAGNATTYTSTDFYSSGYNVNQETDRPRVKPSSFVMKLASAGITDGNDGNLFSPSNKKLNITVEDDDGVKTINYKYKKVGASSWQKEGELSGRNQTSYQFTIQLPDDIAEGRYELLVSATDKEYTSGTSTTSYNITKDDDNKTCFGYSKGAPKVKIDNTNDVYYKPGTAASPEKFDVILDVTNINTLKLRTTEPIKVSKDYATVPTKNDSTGKYEGKVTVPNLDSGNSVEVRYTFYNEFNQSGENTFTFKIDKTKPVETSGYTVKANSKNYVAESWVNTTSIKLDGAFTDNHSGVNTVYAIKGGSSAPASWSGASDTPATRDGTGTSKNYKFSTTVEIDKDNPAIWVKAVDAAGNESDPVVYKFKVDTTYPAIELQTVDGASGVSTKLVNGTKDIKFTVKITDTESKVDDATKIQCVTYSDATKVKKSDNNGVYVYEFTIPADKIKNGGVVVEATDGAGNTARETLFTFSLDKVSPVVTLKNPKNAAGLSGTTVNGTITFDGTATDGSSLDKPPVFYYATEDPGTVTWKNSSATASNDSSKISGKVALIKMSISPDETEGPDGYSWTSKSFNTATTTTPDDDYWFVAEVEDIAGNKGYSTPTKIKINQDTDRPIVKVTNLTNIGTDAAPVYSLKYGTNASVSGSVSDDDSTNEAAVATFVASSSAVISNVTGTTISSGTTSVSKDFVIQNPNYKPNDSTSTEKKYTTGSKSITVKEGDIVYELEQKASADSGEAVTGGSLTAYDVTVFTPSSGEWTFYPYNVEDGGKAVYFFVKDNQNGEFYTGNTTNGTLKQTKFQFKTGDVSNNASGISYTSDKTSPAIESSKIYGDKVTTATPADGDFVGISTDAVMGGTRKNKVKFQIKASDNNGIARMTLELKGSAAGSYKKLKTKVNSSSSETDADGYTYDGSFSATENSDTAIWTTDYIDLSSVKVSGTTILQDTFEVIVNVYDQSDLFVSGSYYFKYDMTPPEVQNITISPSGADTEITGTAELSGGTKDEGDAGVESIMYMIPTSTQRGKSDAALAEDNTWISTMAKGATVNSWKFVLDENDANTKLTKYDSNDYATSINGDVYTLPVYFKITDRVGNVTIHKTTSIKHNPNGDKPRITVTSPTKDKDTSNNELTYSTLSGTIRPSGSVSIPGKTVGGGVAGGGMDAVYIQIAGESQDYAAAKTELASKGYTIVDRDGAKPTGASELIDADTDWWGIKIDLDTSASTWTTQTNPLNRLGEFNPSVTTETNNIKIRVCGVNTNGRLGDWSEDIKIHVSKTVPHAEKVKLQQYESALSAAPTSTDKTKVQKAYDEKNFTFLKGDNWYLAMDLEDTTGINTVSAVYAFATDMANTEATIYTTKGEKASDNTETTDNGHYNKKLWIAIPNDKEQEVKFTITASNNSTPPSEVDISYRVKIDNTPPEIGAITSSTSGSTAAGTVAEFDGSQKIHDSNKRFLIKGTIDKVGGTDNSAFERSVFYFMRKDKVANEDKIIDPFDFDSGVPRKTMVSATPIEVEQDSTTKYNLYGTSISGTLVATTSGTAPNIVSVVNKFTVTTANANKVSDNTNIRKGGIVRIDGIFRKITDKTGDTVTFTPAVIGKDEDDEVTAEFVYGQVVDNVAEQVGDGDNKFTTYGFNFTGDTDDGDGMLETVSSGVGTITTWSAEIRSTNMADGPVDLIILTFDAAGNVSEKRIENSYIDNNPPRIAKVYLGTDLNGNGNYTENEFKEYKFYYANPTSSEIIIGESAKELTSNGFKIKNNLAVVPEIVGGNGTIKMAFNNNASNTSKYSGTLKEQDTSGKVNPTTTKAKTDLGASAAPGSYDESKSNFLKFTLTNAEISPSNVNEGTGKGMSFTFWDATEGTTQGTDSQCAVLYVPDFEVDIVDNVPPKAVVNRFFWRGRGKDDTGNPKNSIYDGDPTNGHIELEGDLAGGSYGTNYTDGAPKVSGKITFRGTVYDDKCLDSIWVYFDGKTLTNGLPDETQIGSTGGPQKDGTYNNPSDSNKTYYQIAKYDNINEEWAKGAGTMTEHGWEFTISESADDGAYFNQDGHRLYWEFSIDTEKITDYTAGLDKNFKLIAVDKSGNVTSLTDALTDTADSAYNRPTYTMDVVPYITKVITRLSALKEDVDETSTNRSALGVYPVWQEERIAVEGFNLTNGITTTTTTNGKEVTTTTGGYVRKFVPKVNSTINALLASGTVNGKTKQYTFLVGQNTGADNASFQSGEWEIYVDDVPAVNNHNNNEAHGTYTVPSTGDKGYANFYNRYMNGENNNNLNDDLKFEVWEFNNRAARNYEGSGPLREPVVKVNPTNGQIGMAFSNGAGRFSMAGKGNTNNYSYGLWQKNYATYRNVALVYDVDGHSHAISTGIDTYPDNGKSGRMSYYTDIWGRSAHTSQSGNFDGTNCVRFECIGLHNTTIHGETIGSDWVIMEERFESPSLAVSKAGTGSYNIYYAYYDDFYNQICFKVGTNNKTSCTWNDSDNDTQVFGQFYTHKGEPGFVDNHRSLIAGQTGANTYITKGDQTLYAGQYVDIAVQKVGTGNADVVVATWYDAVGNKWMYSYNTNPMGQVSKNWTNATYDWATPVKLSNNAGEYCKIAFASDGSVHIAARKSNQILYTYLPKYNRTWSAANTVVVDSGEDFSNIGIDVQEETDGSVIPLITYYANGKAKLAYPVTGLTSTSTVLSGMSSVEGRTSYNGNWEVYYVPTKSTVKKDNLSVCARSSYGTKTSTASFYAAGGQSNGTCAVNGKNNPLLGYAIKEGTKFYIEIAQRKD